VNGGGGSNYIVFQSNGSDDSNLIFFPGGSGDDTIDAFGEDCVIDGDSTDSWGRTSLYGNAGDDFLIPEDSLGYQNSVISPMVAQETIGSRQTPILTAQTHLTP
jgi:Ca2+-binding RTX toxin-like protein